MGTLGAEFSTEPGTFCLKDNTKGNYKLFGLETGELKTSQNHDATHDLVQPKVDLQTLTFREQRQTSS